MVRLKHRWLTVEVKIEEDDLLAEAVRKDARKQYIAELYQQKLEVLRGISETDILDDLARVIYMMYGVMGAGKLLSQLKLVYWDAATGIFVVKSTWTEDKLLRAAVPFMSILRSKVVRPRVLFDSATLMQARHSLVTHLHTAAGRYFLATRKPLHDLNTKEKKIGEMQ